MKEIKPGENVVSIGKENAARSQRMAFRLG